MPAQTTLNVDFARSQFPAIAKSPFSPPFLFADNAGGSQVPATVIERIVDYLSNTNAQLGAEYSISVESTTRVMKVGPYTGKVLFSAASEDEIVFGSSSTLNLENLARGLEAGSSIVVGDEFIVTGEHEGTSLSN